MSVDPSVADLASHCRILFHDRPRHTKLWRWAVLYPLYALSEVAIVSTDLAELLGSAIALSLLFPALPLWGGVLITGADVLLILGLSNPLCSRPAKVFEWIIAALVSSQWLAYPYPTLFNLGSRSSQCSSAW
jgi:metal iron transporter